MKAKLIIALVVAAASFNASASFKQDVEDNAVQIAKVMVTHNKDASIDGYLTYVSETVEAGIADGKACAGITHEYAVAAFKTVQQAKTPEDKKLMRELVEPTKNYVNAYCMASAY